MHWDQILTVFAVIATNLGTVIGLYLHTDSKMESHRKNTESKLEESRRETNAILEAIRQDLRDFHGKLERQDAEFKAHMLHLHEKNK